MLVKHKATGKLGTIPDDKFDPALFEKTGGMDVKNPEFQQTQQPKPQKSIFQNIIDPFVRTVSNIGTAAITVPQAAVASLVSKKKPELGAKIASADILGTQKKAGEISGKPKEALKRQFLDSLNVASYTIPFGKGANIATKALIPGAAVGGIQEATTNEQADIESVAKSALLGGATAGVLEGGSQLVKKALKGTGTVAEKAGTKLSTKSLRPSPSQMYKFSKETGEKIPEFLKKRKLQGADFDKIANYIEPIQNEFDLAVTSSKLKIDPAKVAEGFSNEIKTLQKSILPADQQKAKVLEQIGLNFIEKHGDKPITGKILTELRRQVDTGIKDFALDAAVKTPLQTTRDIFQNTIREAADEAGVKIGERTVKQAGVELSKLYKLRDIAEKTQYKGQGSLPIGIIQLLGVGAGGGVAGIPGAAVGLAASQAANNPSVIGTVSKGLGRFGEFLGNLGSKVPGIGTMAGQMVSRTPSLVAQGSDENNNTQNNQTYDSTNHMISPSMPFQQETTQSISQKGGTGYSTQDLLTAKAAATRVGDTNAVKAISDQIAIQQAYDKTLPSAKPLTSTQQIAKTNAESGLRALAKMDSELAKNPKAIAQAWIPGSPGARIYATARKEASDVLTRLRTGAALNEDEQKFYMSQLPAVLDSAETIKYKMSLFRDLFNTLANPQSATMGIEDVLGGFSMAQ